MVLWRQRGRSPAGERFNGPVLGLATAVLLAGFVGYSLWAALQTHGYATPPYISPIFSRVLRPAAVPTPTWWCFGAGGPLPRR